VTRPALAGSFGQCHGYETPDNTTRLDGAGELAPGPGVRAGAGVVAGLADAVADGVLDGEGAAAGVAG
jgi:hypothetical protein